MDATFTGIEAQHHLSQADDVERCGVRGFHDGKQIGH
jgi:hypothetical protein